MKIIKIANGVKRVEDSDRNATLFRLRDILNEHRSVLITRLVSDLATYIDYKFSARVDARQLESIKDNLYALKSSVIDLDRYPDIIEHFFSHQMTHIRTEPFMREIDENIATTLNLPQLKLV